MSKRQLLQTPEAIERRERRLCREIDRQHDEWMKEVVAYMKANGVDFDTAFVQCGGTIIPDALPKGPAA